MGVVNLPSGQPTMRLTGGAAERLEAILPPGAEAFIHLTITDEAPLAHAFVVIEARGAEFALEPRASWAKLKRTRASKGRPRSPFRYGIQALMGEQRTGRAGLRETCPGAAVNG